jgi:hypothetical protein
MKWLFWLIILTVPLFLPKNIFAQCIPACIPPQVCTFGAGGNSCVTPAGASLPGAGGGTGGGSTVLTALGPIPTEPEELVKWIISKSIMLGAGIAFLLSLWGGVTIILAGGNPEKINEGKEIITSAVSGLLFIIFSVVLLRFIGVDILGIGGFSK